MEDRYLYKAKRIDNGEWEIGSLIILPNGECEIWNRCNNPPDSDPMWRRCVITHKVEPSTICQCTGLKDRHGNLIFENDLMDGFSYPYLSGLDSEHDYFAEVCWCDDITGFGICTHKYKNSDVRGSADGEVDLMENFDSSKWEIIGNIFDNKELLESEE